MEMTGLKMREQRHNKNAAGLAVACAALAFCAATAAQAPASQSTATAGAKPAASAAASAAVPSVPQDKPQKGQELFASPRRATLALDAALEKNDTAELLKVLGPGAKEVLRSGDAAQDRAAMEQFVKKFAEMHRLQIEPDGFTRLYVGAENWPYPIPLARAGLMWFFDTTAGKQEILYRRVGANEITVIQVCGELVAAQKEYFAKPHDGARQGEYAQRILSSTGKQDGLYWPVKSGDPESPLGPFVAKAETEGYTQDVTQRPEPFHGYFFRVLKGQGANAPGGAKSYVQNGRMTGGFGFLAYPAEYRSSGVMTFMVDADGVVYQKDLGPKTEELAKAMRLYNRDASWQKAD
jgi:hypothetical protein